jgi:glc operon protein GlcG
MNLFLAQQFITASLEEARLHQLPIAVAIVDSHGELVSFVRTDKCALHAGVLAPNKAYTAARDRQKSSSLGQWAKTTGKDMGYWTDSRITGIAGGVPITLDGKVIGAIGISGLSEEEDEQLALEVIEKVLANS